MELEMKALKRPQGSPETQVEFAYFEGQGLKIKKEKEWTWVKAKANFPWSHPEEFISFVNLEGEEVFLLPDFKDLDPASLSCIKKSLRESRFCFEIKVIKNVIEMLDLRQWEVETASGPRTFHTKVSHWPTVLDNGQIFVQDLFGDIYRIENPNTMDMESQNHLSAFADF